MEQNGVSQIELSTPYKCFEYCHSQNTPIPLEFLQYIQQAGFSIIPFIITLVPSTLINTAHSNCISTAAIEIESFSCKKYFQ